MSTLPAAVELLHTLAVGLAAEADPVNRLLERVASQGGADAERLRAALVTLGAAVLLDADRPDGRDAK